jgi:chitinase
MVVLGLAFYARAYTLKDPSCTEPQCQYASGSKKGPCSNEAGILLNSEIDDIVKKKSLVPKSWEKETVKMLHWDDQWLTYDDADTFKLKTKFARKRCLGGVMVWAISHDTKEAKYTKALAAAANRKILLLPSTPVQMDKLPGWRLPLGLAAHEAQ